MDKLIEHEQQNLIIDMAEYYFQNWVKDTKEFDQFFFKVVKLAFKHGSDDSRFGFMKHMIKVTSNKDPSLSEMLAEAYKEKEDYGRAYIYYFSANMPYKTVELVLNHLIKQGYPNEAGLYKLRAVLEYLAFNKIESARTCLEKLWDENDNNYYKNMAKAVIVCVEKDRFDVMKKVKENYQAIIASDPSLFEYLNRICVVHFKKPLKQPSMLQSMMESMFS